jgi:hypothetical protein
MNITAFFRGACEFLGLLLLSSFTGALSACGLYFLLKYEGIEFKFIPCWMIMTVLTVNGLYLCRKQDLEGSS